MNAPATTIIDQPNFTDTTATSSLGHHTILTPQRQAGFLDSLKLFGNVRLACRSVSISPQTAYRARHCSAGFARMWDAAMLAARTHAEATLAERAINGIEEPVFYHGEEIARRRRFSDRLLLAHLARLDRLEEREEVCEALSQLEGLIEDLRAGNEPQDRVPSVPSCRVSEAQSVPPCAECGGGCNGPEADLTVADCQWLGNRLDRMDAARPADAPTIYAQQAALLERGHDADVGAIELCQLRAFEAGEAQWWLRTGPDMGLAAGMAGGLEKEFAAGG